MLDIWGPKKLNNSKKYHFADFTHKNYRRLLALVRDFYPVKSFIDFKPRKRFLIMRHDVDFSMRAALKLAKIEKDEGIKSTYFVHFHSEFYNLLEKSVSEQLHGILELDHQVGLHFDSRFYNIDSESLLCRHLEIEKRHLEELIGRKVHVFSFHRTSPFTLGCIKRQYAGMINVYSGYFRNNVGYCSDSNGYWRHRRLEDVLKARADARLQILTHPAWWRDTVMSPRQRVDKCIAERSNETRRTYRQTLEESGRPDIDW